MFYSLVLGFIISGLVSFHGGIIKVAFLLHLYNSYPPILMVPFAGLSKKLWVACFSATLWSLWLARNEATFDSKSWTIDENLFLVKLRSLFWVKALNEEHLISDSLWWIDHVACIPLHPHSSVRLFVPWSPLDHGSWKFNVDGSSLGKPGPLGYGGVFRDANSNIMAIFSSPLGVLDSNVAELLVI
ncbi:hypothetical protein REPUB_Repub05bG0140500 [Reevesia pubescens]